VDRHGIRQSRTIVPSHKACEQKSVFAATRPAVQADLTRHCFVRPQAVQCILCFVEVNFEDVARVPEIPPFAVGKRESDEAVVRKCESLPRAPPCEPPSLPWSRTIPGRRPWPTGA
jgi:hypothetical protein